MSNRSHTEIIYFFIRATETREQTRLLNGKLLLCLSFPLCSFLHFHTFDARHTQSDSINKANIGELLLSRLLSPLTRIYFGINRKSARFITSTSILVCSIANIEISPFCVRAIFLIYVYAVVIIGLLEATRILRIYVRRGRGEYIKLAEANVHETPSGMPSRKKKKKTLLGKDLSQFIAD